MIKWNFKQAWNQTQRLSRTLAKSVGFSNACLLCHYPTEDLDKLICPVCYEDLELFELGTDYLSNNPKASEQIQHDHITGLAVVSEYDWPFNQFIPSLKFYQGVIHAKWLGRLLNQQLEHQLWPEFDLVIPMPLHPLREFKRGYNQAYLIAKHMKSYRDKLQSQILLRRKMTKPQTELNKQQRKQNMKQAFVCNGNVEGMKVLLIDDVVTTGCTVNQAAKVLMEAGASAVYVAAVAIQPLD